VSGGGVGLGLGLGLGVVVSAKNSNRRFAGFGLNPGCRVSCLYVLGMVVSVLGFELYAFGSYGKMQRRCSTAKAMLCQSPRQLPQNTSLGFIHCPRLGAAITRQLMNFAKDGLGPLIIVRLVRDHFVYRPNYHKSHP
jgi:hypothetical protein